MSRRRSRPELSKVAGAPGGLGRVVRVLPGSFHVTDDPGLTIVTVLGSCVAACIRNPWTGFGGLNHFMLPEGSPAEGAAHETAYRFGNYAMEALISAVLASGCDPRDLEVKVFGGADMIGSTSNIGRQNSEFALRFLSLAGIPVSSIDTGGNNGRRIEYNPSNGTVNRLSLRSFEPLVMFNEERILNGLPGLHPIADCL